MRATGLDELPQLINVLRGEMSLVGPRPCIPYEYELYEPWQRRRFDAVPGLTGLWQVSGKNRTTFDQMIQLDIEYSERLSLWLDLKIILKTFPALWQQCLDLACAKAQARPRPSADGYQQIRSSYIAYENNEGHNQGRRGRLRLLGAEPDSQPAAIPGCQLKLICDASEQRLNHMRRLYPEVATTTPFRGPAERRRPGRRGHRHARAVPLRDGQGGV